MALIMEIMQTIAQPISELAVWLEDNFQVEINDTMEKWHELTGMNITVKDGEVDHDRPSSIDVVSSSKSSKTKIPKTKDVCKHVFLSGKRAGEQCSTKPKDGAEFCSAHKSKNKSSVTSEAKKEKKEKKDKKKVEKVQQIDSDFETDEETPLSEEKKVESSTKKKEKKPSKKESVKKVESDDIESEPETRVKPLLSKKSKSKKVEKKIEKTDYNTDDEQLDENLDLEDE